MSALLISLLTVVSALGPELPLGNVRITNAPYPQIVSSVASDGRDFLALWSDQRNFLDPNVARQALSALYAGRVDPSGRPMNPTGHKLFDAASGRMVWTGTSYAIVYTLQTGHSFFQELDSDGNLIGVPKELAIGGAAVAMTSNGDTILLVHTSTTAGTDISTLSKDGTILRTTLIGPAPRVSQPFLLPGGDYAFTTIRTVCPGNVPCINTVWLVTVSASDGSVAENPLFDTTQWPQVSSAASSDGRILIAVQQDQQGARTASYEIIRRDGSVVAPMTVLETEVPRSVSGIGTPAVGWDGREFLVTVQWPSEDERAMSLQAFRVSAEGTRLDSGPLALDEMAYGYNNPPLFASSTAAQLVAWNRVAPGDTDVIVRAARTFDDIADAASHVITTAPALQLFPKLASGPNTFAVWLENEINQSVHGVLIGGNDSALLTGIANIATPPAIAYGRTSYLVAWRLEQPLRVLGRRVSLEGTPLGDPFVIASESTGYFSYSLDETMSIAFDGRNFLVAWIGYDYGVHAARVSDAGTVLDAQPLVISGEMFSTEMAITPRVVVASDGFLVGWLQLRFCGCLFSPRPPPTSKLFLSRVSDTGAVTHLSATWSAGDTDHLVLTSIGNKQLVAIWRDKNDVPNQWCVNRMVFDDNGTPAGGVAALICEPWQGGNPELFADVDAAWDGRELMLVWRNQWTESIFAQTFDPLSAANFNSSLQVNPPGTQAIAPSIAANANGFTIAYQRVADVSRVFARTLQLVGVPRRRASR